jgi:peptidyl-prolyl cis-trans isomerase A (cyclophilin A)
MHRVVTNFIIQGGALAATNRGTTNFTLNAIPTFPPITNEFKVGKFYSNLYGTIAMAKTSDPDSATSQYFFNLANNSASLDNTSNSGGFTVFGHVVSGTNALNAFKIGPTNHIVKVVNLGGILSECPVRYAATNLIHDTDLIYVDISVLNVQIALESNGAREISWNTVSNKLNLVEFTTVLPPIWQTLLSTNGNGSNLTVTDSSTEGPIRFYRVLVAY